jgi:hypothetical protein
MKRNKTFGFSFSWKRALGISGARQSFARRTGVPTTRQGLERKIGASLISTLLSIFVGKRK